MRATHQTAVQQPRQDQVARVPNLTSQPFGRIGSPHPLANQAQRPFCVHSHTRPILGLNDSRPPAFLGRLGRMDVSLDGKVALVTGAGPNIGSGIALMLSKYGARVAVNDVRKEAADATRRRIERNGGTAMSVIGDVTVEDDVKRCQQEVLDSWGRIDILVNNAGL